MPEKDTEQMLAQIFVCPNCGTEVYIMSLEQLKEIGIKFREVDPPEGKDREKMN